MFFVGKSWDDISGKVGSLIKNSIIPGAVLTPRQLVERCGWAPAVEPVVEGFPEDFGSWFIRGSKQGP